VTELNSRFQPVRSMFTGLPSDADSLQGSIKPVRYRYVMAYLHDTLDVDGVTLHKAGEVMAVLPMTSVTYGVGMYSGTELSGSVYIPEMWLTQMPHPPLNVFTQRIHPDQSGIPVGAMFECGNRALYVMRNEKVVWGGILWTRSYSSGSSTMSITGLSWDGYAYYRLVRQSVVFIASTNVYKIWHTVLNQMLHDSTLTGPGNGRYAEVGVVPWTGITTAAKSNIAPVRYQDSWPNNSPKIEMPDADGNTLKLYDGAVESKATESDAFRGYNMPKVGEALEQWADTETLASNAGTGVKKRFEYRVVSWFDTSTQIFRQRYVFGEMNYSTDPGKGEFDDNPTPTGIKRPLLGKNTGRDEDTTIVFDFPGHISEWSLGESMEEAATRVIVTGGEGADDGGATKIADYTAQADLLKVPTSETGVTNLVGSRGWLLYDLTLGTDLTSLTKLDERSQNLLKLVHVPQAAQINDLTQVNSDGKKRTSYRSTDLTITLYTDPSIPFPDWGIGDWATFVIEDPFYGGTMYLQRRIIGYSVTVVPDQENDYSHEQISLDLTDDTKIAVE
jgi:hypothetical protein